MVRVTVVTREDCQVGKFPDRSCAGGHRNQSGIDALPLARALIVGRKEDLVALDGAANGSAELILNKSAAGWGKIVARVQIGVSQELEKVAVKCVAARLGDDVDLAAAEFAILGVKVAGENAELGDGVEIGDDRGPHIHVFFGVASVNDEGVGEFALAVDRNGAGIQIAGRRERAGAHVLHGVGGNRSGRSDAGLHRQKIGIAAIVQGHGRHLVAVDDFAHLAAVGLDVNGAVTHQ